MTKSAEQTAVPQVSYWRIAAALLPGLIVGIVFMLKTGPLPQPLSYHEFADTRVVMGIPHAGDVLTNLFFIIVGALGLRSLKASALPPHSFIDHRERRLFKWLYVGVFLTGFGSGWYHLDPNNYSLTWDRLPMAIAFMSMFAIMITERIKPSLGMALLIPLVAVGIASVFHWVWTEHIGEGDLRWYLLVQFYPMLTMALMIAFLPSIYTRGNDYWGVFLLYSAAKLVELYDREIYGLTHHLISGHSLKHLFAAASSAWLLRMLWLRQPRPMPFKTPEYSSS